MDRKFRLPFLGIAGLYFLTFFGSQTLGNPRLQMLVNSLGIMIVGFSFFVFEFLSRSATQKLMVGWLLIVVLGFIGAIFSLGMFAEFNIVLAVIVGLIFIVEAYLFYTTSEIYPPAPDKEPESNI